MKRSKELNIHYFRRNWRSVILPIIFAIVISALILVATLDTVFFGIPITTDFHLPIALLVLGFLLIRPICKLLDCSYRVSTHHVDATSGILSTRKRHVQLPFEDILGVACEQSVLDRLLGIGDVKVWTAVEDRPEITMEGIKGCEKISSIIRNNIDASRLSGKNASVEKVAGKH